jgi:hypothetical protein
MGYAKAPDAADQDSIPTDSSADSATPIAWAANSRWGDLRDGPVTTAVTSWWCTLALVPSPGLVTETRSTGRVHPVEAALCRRT